MAGDDSSGGDRLTVHIMKRNCLPQKMSNGRMRTMWSGRW